MRKLLISLLAVSMILSGCSHKGKEEQPSPQEEIEEIFEEDPALEEIAEKYDVKEVVYVDQENQQSIFTTIENYIKAHKTEVLILAGAGIIIVSGIGYVFTDLAIAVAAITLIYTIADQEKMQEYIQVVEDNEHVQNIKEYFKTHSVNEVMEDGIDFMKDKFNQFQQTLGVDLPWSFNNE